MPDPGRNRILIWMCALIAVNQLGFGSIVPVIALYARSFGVLQSAIGLAVGIYGLARFLVACLREDVSFKATAGLHHPLRGDYPLTYEPGSACSSMYGFLNLFLATAFLAAGLDEANARRLLEESDPAAVDIGAAQVSWRGHRLTFDHLAASRGSLRSFGSCSFREPIDDLAARGLL